MKFWKFALYTTIGSGLWNCVLATLGWYLHSVVPENQLNAKIEEYNDYIKYAILGIVALVVIFFVVRFYIKKAKGKKVFLASDPDREGEAIAWHIAHILGLNSNDVNRVVFNEITKDAVKDAIKHPRKINTDLVQSQQARRILDRLVGYNISPVLWKKVKPKLSAGRVQNAALKLIVDREEEIQNFIPQEYWTLPIGS